LSSGFWRVRVQIVGPVRLGVALAGILLSGGVAAASTYCIAERATPLQPVDRIQCAELLQSVRNPRALPLEAYQAKLAQFLRNYCHRDEESGWARDKRVRDTGPYIGTLDGGKWTGTYYGTHAPVVTWYSPDMVAWLKANRSNEPAGAAVPPPGSIARTAMLRRATTRPLRRCATSRASTASRWCS
jgi:hypothetical protein